METKVCSKCRLEKSISEFHRKKTENRFNSWCKECVYSLQRVRWKDRKRKLVELCGGKCSNCGYAKNLAALHFHHLDPATKDSEFKNFKELSWKSVVTEIAKCIILCANCHAEMHAPEWNAQFDDSGHSNSILNKGTVLHGGINATGNCPQCNTEVFGTLYCSVPCSQLARRKCQRPTAEELSELIKHHSFCYVGRLFNVSDNAIRKWCKFYGINPVT